MYFNPDNQRGKKPFDMFEDVPDSPTWVVAVQLFLIFSVLRIVMIKTGIMFLSIPILDPLYHKLILFVEELLEQYVG